MPLAPSWCRYWCWPTPLPCWLSCFFPMSARPFPGDRLGGGWIGIANQMTRRKGDSTVILRGEQARRPNSWENRMAAILLDGKQLAQTMQAEIAAGVAGMVQRHGGRPGL